MSYLREYNVSRFVFPPNVCAKYVLKSGTQECSITNPCILFSMVKVRRCPCFVLILVSNGNTVQMAFPSVVQHPVLPMLDFFTDQF